METISNWTSSPAEVYHSEIAPLRMESAAIINLESKRTIDLWGEECYAVPHVLRIKRIPGRDSWSAKALDM